MSGGGAAERAAMLDAARQRQAEGRFDEAIGLLRRAVEAAPADPAGWAALIGCFLAARRAELALQVFEQAKAYAPMTADLFSAQAVALQSLSRVDAAAAAFQAALALDPRHTDARFGLATLAVERGDWDSAEALVSPLVAQPLRRPRLDWLTARIAVGRGDLATARPRLEALAADVRLAPALRAEALLLLGEALDGLGDPDGAFAAAVQGKALQRRLYAERAAGREGEVARLKRLEAWFAAADPGPWRGAPAPRAVPGEAAAHVFLVGFPRSGTTLLEQMLAAHSGIVALEEGPTLAEPYAEFMTGAGDLERLAGLSDAEAQVWRVRYWATVRDAGVVAPGRLFVDKQPAGTLWLPLVAKLFPQARVLFAVRDPRDVVLSCLRQNFQMNAMTYAFTDLAETAACYDACMALARRYRAMLPLAWREVRHEALIGDPATELFALAEWLGLTPEPAMLDLAGASARRLVRTPSAAQLREGLTTRRAGRWRAYADQLAPVMAVLTPWIDAFGYADGASG